MERRSLMLAMGGFVGAWGGGAVLGAEPAAAAGTGGTGGTVVSVLDHGAKGDGTADDTAAFKSALAAVKGVGGPATLLIPPGTYLTGAGLVVGSGTTVSAYGARIVRTGDNGGLLKNFDSVTPVYGYEGAGSIAVLGGTWDMRGGVFSAQSDAMGFAHCEGVLVKDCTFVDTPSAHAVELNAVRNAAVVNCVFDGHHPGDGASLTTKEAVQITCATQGNLPAPAYDATPCEDILITGCTLRPGTTTGPFGALCGDHWGAKGVFHKRIRVIGNTVEKSGAYGVRAADWQDSVIADNTITSTASHAVYLNSPQGNGLSGITVSGNTIRNIEGSGGISVTVPSGGARHRSVTVTGNTIESVKGEAGIYATQTDGLTISRNTVTTTLRTSPTGNCQAIHVQSSPNAIVVGNNLSDVQGDGIGVDSAATGTLVADNTVLTTTGYGISSGVGGATLRGNRITGATAYAVRVGGNAAGTFVQGNTVGAVNGGASAAAIGVMAGSTDTWLVGNDLTGRGAGVAAVADSGAGTTSVQNVV
ncbi:right-handed parallel beta-helix repeat-containing protein [Streptomyces sp. NPDC094032]|uniref:right-handed parallel beta-helix repeat-containing protein n=1 Tax=Streptomyces sp. NPDC094032 TaxID=3155308 RepID=UPI00331A9750